jgi:phosphoribosylanthranilate isomerase
MKIKICGLKYPENIGDIAALKPDYIGFICYAPSPRFAADLDNEILTSVPQTIFKTAVCVNENPETITKLVDTYHFDAIQLHGNEDPEFCSGFRGRVIVIKAFGVDKFFDFDQLYQYVGHVDFFLFDTKTQKHGGSGKSFDWSLLEKYKFDVPFFLSGGLSLENLDEISSISHPQFYGVDLNSRFETLPGLKDIDKLKKAFEILR